jgi:hypothetical protein
MNQQLIIGALVVVIFITILVALNKGRKAAEKFSYMDEGDGAYTEASRQEAAELLKWWFSFTSRIPDIIVLDYIYSVCPDLETIQGISYYNITEWTVNTLKKLKPVLEDVNPANLKYKADVDKVFGRVCAIQLDNDALVYNRNELYDNIPDVPSVYGMI